MLKLAIQLIENCKSHFVQRWITFTMSYARIWYFWIETITNLITKLIVYVYTLIKLTHLVLLRKVMVRYFDFDSMTWWFFFFICLSFLFNLTISIWEFNDLGTFTIYQLISRYTAKLFGFFNTNVFVRLIRTLDTLKWEMRERKKRWWTLNFQKFIRDHSFNWIMFK